MDWFYTIINNNYKMGKIKFENIKSKGNLLVHTCCAPCSTYVFKQLVNTGFTIAGFFYNPNIHPHEEYTVRLEELLLFSGAKNYEIILEEDSENIWQEKTREFEQEKEGGKRCEICFELRLEKTAIFAKHNNFDGFTTTLTISPYKNAELINKIGKKLESRHDIYFLEADFKKNNGFQKSIEISREYNLYRQKYCGCKFSIKNK